MASSSSRQYDIENPTSEIKILLEEWNMDDLLPSFIEENIDVNTLRIMTSDHVVQMSQKFNWKIGVLIRFERYLQDWKSADTFHTPLYHKSERRSDISKTSNRASTTTSNSENVEINIENILLLSWKGRKIIDNYKTNSTLNDGSRKIVINIIIEFIFEKEMKMTEQLRKNIAEAILKIFPTETLDYYFWDGNKRKGEIYNKYRSEVSLLKEAGVEKL